MIVGPSYVFLAVPRTASAAIARHWLMPHYGGMEVVTGEHHDRIVPLEYRRCFTWAVIRNPYERMMSLWRLVSQQFIPGWSTLEPRVRANLQWPNNMEAAWFFRWCARTVQQQFWSQARFLADVRVDQLVRFETLVQDLRRLPFVDQWHDVPKINVTERLLEEELTPELVAAINEHSAPDFEQFGYERLPGVFV